VRHDLHVPKIVLRSETTPTDRRELSVYNTAEGIRVDGWDMGDEVERLKGAREYEWMIDVAERDLPALVAALGGAAGEDVFDVIRRTCIDDPTHLHSVIVRFQIPHQWWHRIGD
jgi:hypothetical protein